MRHPELAELTAAAQQTRFAFLRTDLDLCSTFLDRAEMEEDPETVARLLERVRSADETIERLLADVEDPEHRGEIEKKLGRVRARVETLRGTS